MESGNSGSSSCSIFFISAAVGVGNEVWFIGVWQPNVALPCRGVGEKIEGWRPLRLGIIASISPTGVDAVMPWPNTGVPPHSVQFDGSKLLHWTRRSRGLPLCELLLLLDPLAFTEIGSGSMAPVVSPPFLTNSVSRAHTMLMLTLALVGLASSMRARTCWCSNILSLSERLRLESALRFMTSTSKDSRSSRLLTALERRAPVRFIRFFGGLVCLGGPWPDVPPLAPVADRGRLPVVDVEHLLDARPQFSPELTLLADLAPVSWCFFPGPWRSAAEETESEDALVPRDCGS
mmetsp:Transcript_19171/g.61369  ORF Transcript_19171/g.61369 Transcript_19171/m.61369 type:complete len:291 (-) Transcript_19171:144-1016(-)